MALRISSNSIRSDLVITRGTRHDYRNGRIDVHGLSGQLRTSRQIKSIAERFRAGLQTDRAQQCCGRTEDECNDWCSDARLDDALQVPGLSALNVCVAPSSKEIWVRIDGPTWWSMSARPKTSGRLSTVEGAIGRRGQQRRARSPPHQLLREPSTDLKRKTALSSWFCSQGSPAFRGEESAFDAGECSPELRS